MHGAPLIASREDLVPPVIGLAKLAKMSFDGVDFAPLWQRLTAPFAQQNPDAETYRQMCAALMDLAIIDQMRDNPDRGLAFQAQALGAYRLYRLAGVDAPAKLRVLGFVTAGKINANTPIEFLIEDSDVLMSLLYIVPGMPLPPVPEHDVAFVLAAYSEEALPVLQEIERLVANWPRPVLNLPDRVPKMSRECLYKVLRPVTGIEIPATVRVDRETWEAVGQGKIPIEAVLPDGGFPLIVRPLDSHAGDGLDKISCADDVAAYLAGRPETEFHLSRFVDYRGADGLYRKFRIMVIDGEAFPCHLAVSDHWMIHYLNAGMLESAEKRAEEERFMDCFHEEFRQRHGRALAAMTATLGLDYFGIDCAEMPDGRLLVFEASTALVVHDMDPPEIFPYKSRHMKSVFKAFRALLYRRAEATPSPG